MGNIYTQTWKPPSQLDSWYFNFDVGGPTANIEAEDLGCGVYTGLFFNEISKVQTADADCGVSLVNDVQLPLLFPLARQTHVQRIRLRWKKHLTDLSESSTITMLGEWIPRPTGNTTILIPTKTYTFPDTEPVEEVGEWIVLPAADRLASKLHWLTISIALVKTGGAPELNSVAITEVSIDAELFYK